MDNKSDSLMISLQYRNSRLCSVTLSGSTHSLYSTTIVCCTVWVLRRSRTTAEQHV